MPLIFCIAEMGGFSTQESCQNTLRLTFMDLAAIIHVLGQKGGKETMIVDFDGIIILGALKCWIPTINFILHSRILTAKIISLKSFLLMDWGRFS